MKISVKNAQEIAIMREGGKILKKVLNKVAEIAEVGKSTGELDREAEEMILAAGAFPSFKGYQGFPASICASINDEVVHGIPGSRVLQSGDILKLDCGVLYKGFHTDKALSVIVGASSPEKEKLLEVTKSSLEFGASKIKAGAALGEISSSIQDYVEKAGFNVIRDLVGHGIGREIHEDPPIPNFGYKHSKPILKSGMTLAIEPMVSAGDYRVSIDGWKVVTIDHSLTGHFENTFLVTDGGHEILT